VTEGTEKTETFTNGGTELTKDERRRETSDDVGGYAGGFSGARAARSAAE